MLSRILLVPIEVEEDWRSNEHAGEQHGTDKRGKEQGYDSNV